MNRLCAISVDLDEIPNYFQIHGLADPEGPGRTAVYDLAVQRLRVFAKDAGIPLTLFAIGSDLARPDAARQLREARDDGHEIANHTQDHRYDLTRLAPIAMRAQIEGGILAIETTVGVTPKGFRAPGYTITDEVFELLLELGVQYDASVFPCPPYYLAKTAVIAWLSMRGRPSRSVVDDPNVLLAPTEPYRAGRPYWRTGAGLLEIPVQVTRGLRLPYIGTTVTLAGADRARTLTRMCVGDPLVNLELHGIDVLDADDGLEALRPHQPDVRVPWDEKISALHAAVEVLRGAGYSFVTMLEGAEAAKKQVS